MYGLTILGNNSAIPAYDRHPTAQALHWQDQVLLIDCGEGTQTQLARYKIRHSRIGHIFISHLHGDHCFGLIGLITSLGLMNRLHPLHIHAPEALFPILKQQLAAADTRLPYELVFCPLPNEGILLKEKHLTVRCFPVRHRIACHGFYFEENKPPRKVLKKAAVEAGIPFDFYNRLKMGEDYQPRTGSLIKNEQVTVAAPPPVSYAYCADTLFFPGIAHYLRGVGLLYHEATFLTELEERAIGRFHSTAAQAAQVAHLAKAGKLLIGHFSSQYEDLAPFLEEARAVFAETELALEGVTYLLPRFPW
jgi:ribonuclease Z